MRLQIKRKINSIILDNCKKLCLVFYDVVGIVEIINNRDDRVQGKVPAISISKTDGCHVYLGKNSLACEIVSAKSRDECPNSYRGSDFNEPCLSEQHKSLLNGKKLVTAETEIAN